MLETYVEELIKYKNEIALLDKAWKLYEQQIDREKELCFAERAYELAEPERLAEKVRVNAWCSDTADGIVTESGYAAFNPLELVIDPQADTTANYRPFSLEDLTHRNEEN